MKRRKLVTSCFGFSFCLVISSGCTPGPITILQIIFAVKVVKFLLEASQKLSNNTVYSINVSYKELDGFLRSKNVSSGTVYKMEQRHTYLSECASSLNNKLNQTSSSANKLFSLLEARANQNNTSELKDKMLSDIQGKKDLFGEKMKVAQDVVSGVKESVQKYDDILGYIQVGSGLNQIDQYINDVDNVIKQAASLDSEIQTALNQNHAIIASFDNPNLKT